MAFKLKMYVTVLLTVTACAIVNASPLSARRARAHQHRALGSRAVGFQLMPSEALERTDLSSTCKGVLGQTIQCEEYVASLGARDYHGSLDDKQLTDAVCVASCRTSLQNAQRRLLGACADTPEIWPGYPVTALVESVLSGWNETCLKDPDTGAYCNDVIESWEEYEDIEDMAEKELCSFCFGAKLRMMQASPYSAYDELYAEMLKHVNKNCAVESPTSPQLPPWSGQDPLPDQECPRNATYTTRDGDTCDSIALDKSLSAATLYYINPDLLNCSGIAGGQTLCLPESCASIHQVQQDDNCIELALDAGASWLNIIDWNLGIDRRCSNIWATEPYWGRTICTSQPGGEFVDDGGSIGNPGSGNTGGEGGSGDGYADTIAPVPSEGGGPAQGTTLYCGLWVQAKSGSTCSSILVSTTSAVPIRLFLEANPSLGSSSQCDGNLVEGSWYCLNPNRHWRELEDAAEA
ncbi:LysM domain protein [Sarocladium implicatum]|nr:LysM domain protein [Sarocladium implicatum]